MKLSPDTRSFGLLFRFWLVFAAGIQLAYAEETNLVTFTNRVGEVFTNVRISGANAIVMYVWTTNGAGRTVPLADAPQFLQKKFHYDPAAAAAATVRAEKERKAYASNYAASVKRMKDQIAYKNRRAEFIASLRVVEGEVVQRADGLVHIQRTIIPSDRMAGGTGSWGGVKDRVAVKNFRNWDIAQSGMKLRFKAKYIGEYAYTTITGDDKKIPLFDAAIPDEYANDDEVKGAMAIYELHPARGTSPWNAL